ncbi:hypothetical protein [Qingshengfaniella alkalisoli]|nr:hypothetical protein [Qingshengfaniella alkalisoli]
MDLATFFSFELADDVSPVVRKAELADIGAPGVKYLLVAAQIVDFR